MYLGPTPGLVPDEVRARLAAARARDLALLAARDQALNRIARGAALVALAALVVFGWLGGRAGIWAPAQLFAGLFVVLLGLALGKRLPFIPRAVTAVALFYAAGLAARLWLGLDSASWILLGGCAALAALLFGTRPGLFTALLALATWAGLASFAAALPFQPLSAETVAPFAWLLNGASLAMVLVALILPQRQFVEGQAAAAIAAQVEAGMQIQPRPAAAERPVSPADQRRPTADFQTPEARSDQDLGIAALEPEPAGPADRVAEPAPAVLRWAPGWPQDQWGQAGLFMAAYVVLVGAWTFFHWGGADNVALISDLATLPVSLFAALCAWRVASYSRFEPQLRSAWLILGFTAISQFAADLIWFFFEIVLHTPAFPSPADILYLSFYPLVLWGLLALPGGQVPRKDRPRFWLLLAGLLVVASALIGQFIILPVAASAENDLLVEILSAAYPIGDIIILAGALSILVRRPPANVRNPLLLYLAGLVIFFGGDLAYGVASLSGKYASGDPLDVTWTAAYLLFGLAAIQQHSLARQALPREAGARALPAPQTSRNTILYTALGTLFGLAFPVAATLLDLVLQQLPVSLANIGAVQIGSPLHWIIDTAPIVLGLIFGLGGLRQDQAEQANAALSQEVGGHQRTIVQLRQLEASLKQQVTARTADLEESARQTRRRAEQLAVSAEVAREAAALRDLPELLGTAVRLISVRFGYYHAGVFLVDETGEYAVLKASNSPGGQKMLARNHRLRVGAEGIVGYVTQAGEPRIAFDVGADAVHFVNPDLPQTHSEMAVPLKVRGKVIGALDVQSTETNAFSDDDAQTLQSLASLLAVAIDNARLLSETRRSLDESRALQQAARQAAIGAAAAPSSFRYDGVEVEDLGPGPQTERPADPGVLQVPINLGGEALGLLELKRGEQDWSADDIELTQAIAARMAVALEGARLFEATRASLAETQRLVEREQAVSELGTRLQHATSVAAVLRVAAEELRRVTGSQHAVIRLNQEGEGL